MNPAEVCKLVEDICLKFATHPEAIKLDVLAGHHVTSISVIAHDADVRRLIGRQGRTFNSLKQIVSAMGDLLGHNIILMTVKGNGSMDSHLPPFLLNPDWDAEGVLKLLDRLLAMLDGDAMVSQERKGSEVRVTIHSKSRVVVNVRPSIQNLFAALALANSGTITVDQDESNPN